MLPNYNDCNNLFVNASAIKRILNVPQSRRVEFLEVTPGAVKVEVQKVGTVTITRAQFEREFVRYRHEGSKECLAAPHNCGSWGETFKVTGAKGDVYYCEAGNETIACTCEDWHQHEALCKHGWAVLNSLNLHSFDQYLAARAQAKSTVVNLDEHRRRRALAVNGRSIE